jgi:methionyl-tRNA synthetase
MPESRSPTRDDAVLLAKIDAGLVEAGEMLERVELRAGLRQAMDGAQAVNVYLNAQAPWLLRRHDPDRAETVLHTALSAVNGLKVAFSPYLPFSSAQLHTMLGQPGSGSDGGWKRSPLAEDAILDAPRPLFAKLDSDLPE